MRSSRGVKRQRNERISDSAAAAGVLKDKNATEVQKKQKKPKRSVDHAASSAAPCSTLSTPETPSQSPIGEPCHNALLVAATYHSVMAGLVFKKEKFFIKFSTKRHVGCVNQVAVTERYIASCGVDERVFLFTNKADHTVSAALRERMRKTGEPLAVRLADLGSLTPPSEVLCMRFTEGSQYLLCGLADGQLLIYKSRDWSLSVSLPVHEKGLLALDVHPGSNGALAVSVGVDRVVAVLDLSKGRLMTKWKYTSHVLKADTAEEDDDIQHEDEDAPERAEDDEQPARKKSKKALLRDERARNPLARLQQREDPISVHFSPSGNYFIAFSRYSFVVYCTATMRPTYTFRFERPQPLDEFHAACLIDDATLVLGNEAGRMLFCDLSCATPLTPVELSVATVEYPEALQVEAAALADTSSATNASATLGVRERESRLKNPLRHTARIKSICKRDGTLFSIDSNGIVIAWNLERAATSSLPSAVDLKLNYVASANCQGRVTFMSAIAL